MYLTIAYPLYLNHRQIRTSPQRRQKFLLMFQERILCFGKAKIHRSQFRIHTILWVRHENSSDLKKRGWKKLRYAVCRKHPSNYVPFTVPERTEPPVSETWMGYIERSAHVHSCPAILPTRTAFLCVMSPCSYPCNVACTKRPKALPHRAQYEGTERQVV